jgi:outer membrane protein TolC
MFVPTVAASMLVATLALAQGSEPSRPLPAVVDDYVRAGLASNLQLANQSLEVERSLAALAAARARFLPEVTLNGRYTRADGGREFTVPVSQLLNPVYQTLNDLLIAAGGTAQFPPLGDQSFPLQLPREQDTRVTLRQPLYVPAIAASAAAARANASAADYAREAVARALQRDITVAYLNWLKATTSARIVAASIELLQENERVNESLFTNGRVTEDNVLRARAELLKVQQQLHEADNAAAQAASYLNFLLNRPLATPLEAASMPETPDADGEGAADVTAAPGGDAGALLPAAEAAETARAARPELKALDQAGVAAAARLRAAHATRRPSLALGVDAGTQGADYGLGRDYNFVTASLVFSWTLFDGGERAAAVAQARVETRKVENQRSEEAQRIELEVRQALDNLRTEQLSLAAARTRAAAARAGFRIASRKRDEGMATQVEFLDARNTLTGAELNLNWTRFDLLQRAAELDYALAAGTLPLPGG